MTTEHDREHLEALIAAHTRRLRVIEVSIARKGDSAEPELQVEAERIQRELEMLQQGAKHIISPDIVDALGPVGQYQVLYANIMRLDGDILVARRELVGDIADVRRSVDAVFGRLGEIEERLVSLDARLQRGEGRLLAVVAGGFVALVVVVVALAFGRR